MGQYQSKYSYNQVHVHPEARLSGVFYVSGAENSGDICFTRSNGYYLEQLFSTLLDTVVVNGVIHLRK